MNRLQGESVKSTLYGWSMCMRMNQWSEYNGNSVLGINIFIVKSKMVNAFSHVFIRTLFNIEHYFRLRIKSILFMCIMSLWSFKIYIYMWLSEWNMCIYIELFMLYSSNLIFVLNRWFHFGRIVLCCLEFHFSFINATSLALQFTLSFSLFISLSLCSSIALVRFVIFTQRAHLHRLATRTIAHLLVIFKFVLSYTW